MSPILIGLIAAVVVIIIIVIIVFAKQRGDSTTEATLDPPYGRKSVPDPTKDDPQLAPEAAPEDVRFPDGPDNIRRPDIDNTSVKPTPKTFPPPGPPRE